MSTLHLSSPLQFAASYTADFIAASIPVTSRTLLDVGCGDGLITRQLQLRGYDVVAVDSSLKGVERARKNGVDAIHCKLEEFDHLPFEGIYMSRALHHMPPLKETLSKIGKLLTDDGTLVIEDFGFDLANEAACDWLFEQSHKVLAERSEPIQCEFHHEWLHTQIKSPGDPYAIWKDRYITEHQLWSSSQMVSALEEYFSVHSQTKVPYLFRFICDLLPGTEAGARRAREIFASEQNLIDKSAIAAVGLRLVVSKRS
jgi:SAM-dependent methyltransferase